ncbi:ribosome biogenesis GTP-binding protein YihA/YsxC [Desulfolithobacter sp.]
MDFSRVEFIKGVYSLKDLPEPVWPEIAFAGRSNVGKSSLINRLIRRRNLVKTSSRPGKTQALNYFSVDERMYLVDLPGYGFARVPRQMRSSWEQLITGYLEKRESLVCVVVIIDLRHELKSQDRELVDWLRYHHKPFLPVYTKADKLSKNKQMKNAAALDAALTITPDRRVLFSARTGQGREELESRLANYVENW